jgi:hypothetical protein
MQRRRGAQLVLRELEAALAQLDDVGLHGGTV